VARPVSQARSRVGTAMFGMTTFVLSCINAGFFGGIGP
jgi:succinate-acetate transporter protein